MADYEFIQWRPLLSIYYIGFNPYVQKSVISGGFLMKFIKLLLPHILFSQHSAKTQLQQLFFSGEYYPFAHKGKITIIINYYY